MRKFESKTKANLFYKRTASEFQIDWSLLIYICCSDEQHWVNAVKFSTPSVLSFSLSVALWNVFHSSILVCKISIALFEIHKSKFYLHDSSAASLHPISEYFLTKFKTNININRRTHTNTEKERNKQTQMQTDWFAGCRKLSTSVIATSVLPERNFILHCRLSARYHLWWLGKWIGFCCYFFVLLLLFANIICNRSGTIKHERFSANKKIQTHTLTQMHARSCATLWSSTSSCSVCNADAIVLECMHHARVLPVRLSKSWWWCKFQTFSMW